MIVKILPRHSPGYASLLKYILNDEKVTSVYTHNLRGKAMDEWVQEYIENEASRKQQRSDQVYLYHEIISLSAKENKDVITKDMLDDLVEKYISLRGNTGMFVGAVHQDKEHVHIHLCSSGLEYRTGKAFRLSRDELHKLKVGFQSYHKEKYPELSQSFCKHGKGQNRLTDREWQLKNRTKRMLNKEILMEKVQACFKQAKTQTEFLSFLRDSGFHHYERNGIPAGIIHDEMKYRFSCFDLPKEQFNSLSVDNLDERKALDEIRNLRESRREKDRDYESYEIF